MAYRVRTICEVKYGHFGAYFSAMKKLAKISEARGWAPLRLMVPTAGQNNQLVMEQEYPDLATFQKENDLFYSDEEAFEVFRGSAEHVVQGTARTEIYEDMPADFPGSE